MRIDLGAKVRVGDDVRLATAGSEIRGRERA